MSTTLDRARRRHNRQDWSVGRTRMNADQVRAYVAAKWPEALQSPAARLMAAASAMAALEASDPDAVIKRDQDLRDAKEHAEACLATRGGWDVEALSDNIRSEFWQHLTSEDCDDVARQAIAIWAQPADRGRFAEFSDGSSIDVEVHQIEVPA